MEKKIKCRLLHVGYHKCGSTFLQEEIFEVSSAVNTLDRSALSTQTRLILRGAIDYDRAETIRAIAQHCNGKKKPIVVSDEKMIGRADTTQHIDRIFDEISEIFDPDCVLLIVRNPLDYIYSIWSNHIRLGGTMSLRRYLYHQASPARFKNDHALLFKLNYAEYAKSLASRFGHDKVHIMILEDLKRDQVAFVEKLSDLTGVPLTVGNASARPQASLSLTGNRVARIFNLFFNSVLNGGPLAVLPGQKSWRATLERVFEDPSGSGEKRRSYVRRHLKPADLGLLVEYVEALEAYLQRDLTELGYPKRRH